MIIEDLVIWLLQRSDQNPNPNYVALNVSNILLLCYFVTYLFNRKAVFISVFFVSEVMAYSSFIDFLPDEIYYLLFASLYSALYHFLYITNVKLNTVFACAIIILFSTGAALDASFYPKTETIFYNNYEFLAMAVHLYFIYTLINWRLLRSFVGTSINSFARFVGANYSMSLFCYTHLNNTKKDFKI